MRLLAPPRFTDELLSSLWTRMCRRTYMPITSLTTRLLGRKWTPAFFQAGHIGQTASHFGLSPERLLSLHTVFPYATAFMAPQTRACALQNVLSVGIAARGMGAVTQSVSDHVDTKRFCHECARQEYRATGESYWHRGHNLPGVVLCLKHGCALHEVQDSRTSGTASWSYLLPHEVKGTRLPKAPSISRPYLETLARLSVKALEEPYGYFSLTKPESYRKELVGRGLVTDGSQIDSNALSRLAAETVSRCLPKSMTTLHEKFAAGRWAALMVRPGIGVPFIPLKHLILHTALAHSGDDKVIAGALDYRAKPHYLGKHREVVDESGSGTMRRLIDEAMSSGQKLSVSDALRATGHFQLYRHDPEQFPLIAAQVLRLRCSPSSLRRTSTRRIAMAQKRRLSCDS